MENYVVEMNKSINQLFKSAKNLGFNLPLSIFLLKLLINQKHSAKIRKRNEVLGTHVPPFLIASITNRCNLSCRGCYSHQFNQIKSSDLTDDKWEHIFSQANSLGISFILLAGGEPFLREEVIKSAAKYRNIIFPVFTNSTLISEAKIKWLKKAKNIVVVASIEGEVNQTDERRGSGVSIKIENALNLMNKAKMFFGLSFTVTASNYETITNEDYINDYYQKGCKLFFYVEYVPVEKNSEGLVITQEQRISLDERLNALRTKFKALFIAFPGDEKKFGGCLSSGRGFIHISHNGNLEPCPFAPFSDTSLKDITLKEALGSKFLKRIRESNEHLSETEHGCALFNKKEFVLAMLNKHE